MNFYVLPFSKKSSLVKMKLELTHFSVQMLLYDLCVDGCRCDVGMPEDLLDLADRDSVGQHVSGSRVAQIMASSIDRRITGQTDGMETMRSSALVDAGKNIPNILLQRLQEIDYFRDQGDRPLPIALAGQGDMGVVARKMDVAPGKCKRFVSPGSGPQVEFRHSGEFRAQFDGFGQHGCNLVGL